jgi:hypothetical protein
MHRRVTRGHVALAIALVVNVLLGAGYLWSRDGQTTVLRIEARGDQFTASVDGNSPMTVRFPGTQAGGIDLRFNDTSGLTSLPSPSGVDRIRVEDIQSGAVLFEDDFSGSAPGEWEYTRGALRRQGGLLTGDPNGQASLGSKRWRDVAIEVRYRNVTQGTINLRAVDHDTFVEFHFMQFDHWFQQFVHYSPSGQQIEYGPRSEPARMEILRSMIAMVVRPYPLILALTLAAGVVYAAVAAAAPAFSRWKLDVRGPAVPAWTPAAVAVGIAITLVLATAVINTRYASRLPHWPDAAAYIFQAKIFASGRLVAPAPQVVQSFDFFNPTFTPVHEGRWASVFPFGHPLLLAVGEFVGAMWLMPPLAGGASALFVFFIGRRWFGAGTALVASLLFATSPFVLMQSSNFMSHGSAAFYMLAALACLVLPSNRLLVGGLLAGVFFGLLFNTRPLSSVALAPAFAALLAAPLVRRDTGSVARAAGFAAGALAMLAAYLLYNLTISGDAFNSTYGTWNGTSLGFGGPLSVSGAMQNDQTNLAYLLLVLNGWPQYVGLLFVLLPFALGSTSWRDWWLLLAAMPVLAIYTLYDGNGVMQGPRFWYEATPFLMLLTARGAVVLVDAVAAAVRSQHERMPWLADRRGGRGVLLAGAYLCLAALMGASVYGWLFGRHEGWRAENVPATAAALRGFARVDDRMRSLLNDADLHNALVLVDDCPDWECYGSVFWMNDASLEGGVVYAKNLPQYNDELFLAYADREVYVANYQESYIAPYGVNVPEGYKGVLAGDAPRAGDISASALPRETR